MNRVKTKRRAIVFCCTLNEARMHNENDQIKKFIDKADLRTADGMPLVWGMRFKIGSGERVYGPDLMKNIFNSDNTKKLKHFFLGNTNKTLIKIKRKLISEYGYRSTNVGFYSPKFKQKFSQNDYKRFERIIKNFNPDIVWVGMGAEKQLVVASQLSKRVMGMVWITVGAAFDYFAGTKKQCPRLIRRMGFEWLFRWLMEPRRLTKRYFKILQFLYRSVDVKKKQGCGIKHS